jgi:hypothetical protein
MTKAERILTMAVSLIGCAAAVIVVPEVRCAVGLDAAPQCGAGADVATLLPSTTATLRPTPREDRRIDPIRQRYNWIENGRNVTRHEPVALAWRGADSASVIVYTDPGGVAKITARVYNGLERNVLKFYYDGASLVFIHQVMQNLHPETNQFEQRFYFERGHMIRWLAPGGAVSAESPEFRANSDQLMGLGTDLLQLAAGLPRAGG